MINRFYKDGEKLDVAGLNEITVLIDRSETDHTEVGLNKWRPNLDGPPHKHNDKDQVFYITSGEGIVKLGKDAFEVNSGSLAYVPAGLVHQTITTSDESLCYLLFNVFNKEGKEGHLSFADHIEKVKLIRKQQAESGSAGSDGNEDQITQILPSKFFRDIKTEINSLSESGEKKLLNENETQRFEFSLIKNNCDESGEDLYSGENEITLFIISGEGDISISKEKDNIKPGSVVFIPKQSNYSLAISNNLVYLCLRAH